MANDNRNTPAASANSLRVMDKQGNPLDFGKVLIELASLTGSGGGANISVTQVPDIDTLRKTEPSAPGDMAVVLEYSNNSRVGGGLFVYHPNDSSKEDYGVVIVTVGGKRWKRNITDYNALTVLDFGAIEGGDKDCAEAVKRMHNWAQSNARFKTVGIRFPAGKFLLSTLNIANTSVSHFKVSGAAVDFGYFAATQLVSDRKNNEYVFDVLAKRVEIVGINFNGEYNVQSNTKGFYRNHTAQGQYLRVSCVNFDQVGGRCISVLDTLDCKIDQWYASDCQDTVIYGFWTDGEHGWNHLTAIELSNFNAQNCKNKPVIDLQRATQSLIRNGWIEHCDYPGDISNGQWIIDALSIESTMQPMKCHYTRAITLQRNLQSGASMDFSPVGDRYLSEYELGDVDIANHGVNVNGSLNYLYETSQVHLSNFAEKESWFKLGMIELPGIGSQAHLRVIGSAGYNVIRETATASTTRTAEGVADLWFQRIDAHGILELDVGVTWASKGSSPVSKVWVERLGNGKADVYVRLPGYSTHNVVLIDTNVVDQFQNGVHFRFIRALAADNKNNYLACDAAQNTALNAKTDYAFHQHWEGNNKVGYGFNNNDELLIQGTLANESNFDVSSACLKVIINGKQYGLPLRELKS
ncbi:hypothetical protein [Duffyella gerundensis]|uniref:hypothetical protein n=1 Tax=Duffyella TaxID=3026546 RepID=UPI003F6E2627